MPVSYYIILVELFVHNFYKGIGVGVGGISALYGSAVTRAVLGPLASAPMLNKSTWSWSKWSTLSIVPWALMFYVS